MRMSRLVTISCTFAIVWLPDASPGPRWMALHGSPAGLGVTSPTAWVLGRGITPAADADADANVSATAIAKVDANAGAGAGPELGVDAAAAAHANADVDVDVDAAATPQAAATLVSLETLTTQAKARVSGTARVPLADAGLPALDTSLRLGAPTSPNYVRAMSRLPQAAQPLAAMVHAVLYRGALSTETKAAMALRIAQVNGSPYVAAHAMRALRASSAGHAALLVLSSGALGRLSPPDRAAVSYAESLTRDIHGVTDEDFALARGLFNDSEIVELTIVTAFFNAFTRYAEALRLPVESWAMDTPGPAPWRGSSAGSRARVALLADDEITAAGAVLAASKETTASAGGLGLGMANSQRAMLRAPALGLAWRAYGAALREKETVGRDIKLQVSFAVSWQNQCRYCTIHQVVGLRRLGVDIAKLVAMQKDDSALTPREAVAVRFARTLTTKPGGLTDADYAALTTEFGDLGAFEVLLQVCQFAFMNRFTDGLRLPSEDEAVRIYQETYGSGWKGTK